MGIIIHISSKQFFSSEQIFTWNKTTRLMTIEIAGGGSRSQIDHLLMRRRCLMVAADLGREGAAVANRQGNGEELACAEQEKLAPSLATGRSPRALLGDDIPYNGASTVVLASEHAALPLPHERTAFLSRFIQCHLRGCFFYKYTSLQRALLRPP